MTARTSTNLWIDIVSVVVMISLTATGGLIHYVLPPGTGRSHSLLGLGRHDYGQIHFYLALAAVAMLAVHVLLHWSWICSVIARALGGAALSRRARTAWGVSTLAFVSLFIGGGLWGATRMVEPTTPSSGGRARIGAGEHHHGPGLKVRGRVADPSAAVCAPGQVAACQAPRAGWRGGSRGRHLGNCTAGASINGRTSLAAAAKICRVSLEQMTRHLALPRGVDPLERLGRLGRRHGFAMYDVRRLACRGPGSPRRASAE